MNETSVDTFASEGCSQVLNRNLPLSDSLSTSVPECGKMEGHAIQLASEKVSEKSSPSENQSPSLEDDSSSSCIPEDIGDVAKQMDKLSVHPDESVTSIKKSSAESSPASINRGPEEYQLKWIMWHDHKTPIITQNQNGPCPLIAIANILLLRGKMKLSSNASTITAEELLTHVANNIVESRPEENSEEIMRNFEQNMHDAMSLLPQLHSGLDVNIKFTGVNHFEFTEACTVFDLLDISLYHGWVVDPQATETVQALGNMGYNQLVEMIIQDKMADDSSKVTKALLAEQFLESSASQLTYHGLCELNSVMADNELAVLFRNNHFSTIFKRRVPTRSRESKQSIEQVQNELFLLVTDQGFLHEFNVVWEMLCNIEGDSMFVDSAFKNVPPKSAPEFSPAPNTMSQIDQDYMVALALQEDMQRLDDSWEDVKKSHPDEDLSELSDEELARLIHKKEMEGAAEQERVNKQLAEQSQQPTTVGNQASPTCSCNSSDCSHRPPVCAVETCTPNPSGSPTSSSHKKNACSVL
ncbi:ubiquitin carboxyl-terminal hydrolase MINDY-1 [Frankliniella occidentalis]|uniref:Ubiquitin carboxyl-terminal hydrolase n=1 Tax=Frankliniella occidentalis TaxID=133901 RepID=A0A9C6X5A7_FRAOC|nr:ubiquitin carboxyl-terminal hydrolase MINDY-1 [Frankliniella occidentalis]